MELTIIYCKATEVVAPENSKLKSRIDRLKGWRESVCDKMEDFKFICIGQLGMINYRHHSGVGASWQNTNNATPLRKLCKELCAGLNPIAERKN